MSTPNPNPRPSPRTSASVREAKPSEFAAVAQLARKAFVHDPVFNYFGGVKELIPDDVDTPEGDNLHRFVSFMVQWHSLSGGRITVVVINDEVPAEGSGGVREKIVCAGLWSPPNKRPALRQIPRLFHRGTIGVLRGWGLSGLNRVWLECSASHAIIAAGYKAKGVKTPDASWCLQMVMTDPSYEGQGMMSMLMREAFAHAEPGTPFVLEATSIHSRDRYEHMGYESFEPFVLGAGKINELGLLTSSKKQAVGVRYYPMVYWNERKYL
ncbi:hypothetical protein BD779DRAFT_1799447 [Infundibulicybe gibba]|nr:hypothetical protein BD779DRAFT_1799447 [Infundibulicybe gibba]